MDITQQIPPDEKADAEGRSAKGLGDNDDGDDHDDARMLVAQRMVRLSQFHSESFIINRRKCKMANYK